MDNFKDAFYIEKYGSIDNPKTYPEALYQDRYMKSYYSNGEAHFIVLAQDENNFNEVEEIYDAEDLTKIKLITIANTYYNEDSNYEFTKHTYNSKEDYNKKRHSIVTLAYNQNYLDKVSDFALFDKIPAIQATLPDNLSNIKPAAIVDTAYFDTSVEGNPAYQKFNRKTIYSIPNKNNDKITTTYTFEDTYYLDNRPTSHPIYASTSATSEYTISTSSIYDNTIPVNDKKYVVTIPDAKAWINDINAYTEPELVSDKTYYTDEEMER